MKLGKQQSPLNSREVQITLDKGGSETGRKVIERTYSLEDPKQKQDTWDAIALILVGVGLTFLCFRMWSLIIH